MASASCKVEKATGNSIAVIDGDLFIGSVQSLDIEYPEEGYHRLRYYMCLYGRSDRQTRQILSDLIYQGKAEAKRFRVPQSNGVINLITHYKLHHEK